MQPAATDNGDAALRLAPGAIPISPSRRRSIGFKLAALVAGMLVLAALVMNVIAYAVARQIVRGQIHERLKVIASDRHAMILAYVAQQHERVALVASRTRLRELVETHAAGSIPTEAMRRGTRPILNDARDSTKGFLDIWFCDANGNVLTATKDDYLGRNFADDPSYQQGRRFKHLGEPWSEAGQLRAHLAAPALGNDGQLLGVVMVLLDVNPLTEIIVHAHGLGTTGQLLIATLEGERIRYLMPQRNEKFGDVPLSEVAVMQAGIEGKVSDEIVEARYQGVPVLAQFQPIAYQRSDYRPWGLVVKIDVDEAYRPVAQLARILFLTESGVLVVGLAVALLLARRFTRPLHDLTEAASVIASGDLSARAKVYSADEIGTLATAFNRMAEQIAAWRDHLEQRVKQRTAELTQEIEQHKYTQADLRLARDAAQGASQAKSEFLANMSHEIRTPMNGVIGMAELLTKTELSDEQREYLDMIQQSADALLRLINDILDYSKIEAGRLELESIPFDLRDTVGKTGKTLALRAAEKGIELACRIQPDLPDTLIGDPGRLRQILVNLVGNAIKFTDRGEIEIDVAPHRTNDGQTELRFSVRDTGIGIPPEKQEAIFESFTQVDTSTTRRYGGTGLGLAISTQLVDLMDGRIWVESEPGMGTTLHFTARFGVSDEQPLRVSDRAPSFRKLPTLIVDDNATNRRILDEVLRSWQMPAASVDCAMAALEELGRAAQLCQPYRLVLLDCMMPEMDGFMLAERIRRDDALGSPVLIMISSAAHPGDSDRCQQLGIARYLIKPVVQSELFSAVIEAFSQNVPNEALKVNTTTGNFTSGLRILLAEDGLVNQRVAQGFLKRQNHEVLLAGNGSEAIEMWEREPFDVILMDVQMPVLDGFEATRRIRRLERATGRHTPIIAMTAAAMQGDREDCLAAGMDGYVAKPIDPELLFQTIDACVNDSVGASGKASPTSAANLGDCSNLDVPGIFDHKLALQSTGGDIAILRELAVLFMAEVPQFVAQIHEGLAQQQADIVRRAAHTIKGTAYIFAAEIVIELAAEIESQARTFDLAETADTLAALEQELDRLMAALRALMLAP